MHKLIWNLSGGRLGRKAAGMPVLELSTTGHKSGLQRQILITYVEHRGAPAIIGTNAGRNTDPAWVHNLRANPDARARWDGIWHDVVAAELSGADYEEVWSDAVAVNPGYAPYRESLTRPIPIFRLGPVDS
jgi:deazaflavin-dependent oxidoreductase (nitroreductase family)